MLNITSNNTNAANIILDLKALRDTLLEKIELPEGELQLQGIIEGVKVLFLDFDIHTQCSKASYSDFTGLEETVRLYDLAALDDKVITKNVSLSFFVLDKSEIAELDMFDPSYKRTKVSYGFPEPEDEMARISTLFQSLVAYLGTDYDVYMVEKKGQKHHYCEFTGCGDLCVAKSVNHPPLVYTVLPEGEDDETTSVSASTPERDSSPRSSGTPSVSFIKGDCEDGPLKYQLWANMIAITVGKFSLAIVKENLTKKQDLIDLKALHAYGIACTGVGKVGSYKLEMDLIGGKTKVITKASMKSHGQLNAAIVMDYVLDQFIAQSSPRDDLAEN